jgi:hypothetical protein
MMKQTIKHEFQSYAIERLVPNGRAEGAHFLGVGRSEFIEHVLFLLTSENIGEQ